MTWRAIHVDGEEHRWTVSVSTPKRSPLGELASLRVTLVVRPQTRAPRIEATFHGFCLEDLWDGRRQSLTVTPRIVADVIRLARTKGPRLDHAEQWFPAAVTSADPADTQLAAACAQWFVPYPGRAALIDALAQTGRDFAAVAERFSTPSFRLAVGQIAGWVVRLGI